MDVPCSFDAKFRWLQRHFPFIPPSHIVFCGDKSIVDADYLIDDRSRHFTRFKGEPLLFSAPHNAGETAIRAWRPGKTCGTTLRSSRHIPDPPSPRQINRRYGETRRRERRRERVQRSEPRERSEPAKRLARERVGESEGRSPSD